ncbi:hypothetical protein BVRB_5g106190 [Beta vulgaris subsp. vulgaris]|nr:hypothetical protein BVRB_5g106190 [Beta vulgaris subsp. vulgaris]
MLLPPTSTEAKQLTLTPHLQNLFFVLYKYDGYA